MEAASPTSASPTDPLLAPRRGYKLMADTGDARVYAHVNRAIAMVAPPEAVAGLDAGAWEWAAGFSPSAVTETTSERRKAAPKVVPDTVLATWRGVELRAGVEGHVVETNARAAEQLAAGRSAAHGGWIAIVVLMSEKSKSRRKRKRDEAKEVAK